MLPKTQPPKPSADANASNVERQTSNDPKIFESDHDHAKHNDPDKSGEADDKKDENLIKVEARTLLKQKY